MDLHCTFLAPGVGWAGLVAELDRDLGGPGNPLLLPPHFLQSTFPRIGGRIVLLEQAGMLLAAGMLFPRDSLAGRRRYTLRLHRRDPTLELGRAAALVAAALAPDEVLLYDPEAPQHYLSDGVTAGEFSIGAPAAAEAAAARELQQTIWGGAPGSLYPADLYAPAFAAGTALVARHTGQVVAFLLGFLRFGALAPLDRPGLPYRSDLCVESQLLGIAPSVRRGGLAALLKRAQARDARARGINIIHWTADPLQFGNAVLNFSRLRALAFTWLPDYYAFRNELNRVPASRLGLTWLLDSAYALPGITGTSRDPLFDPADLPGCRILNAGPRLLAEADGAPTLAIEIPADWTALQRDQPERAATWRQISDQLFAAYLGLAPDRYVICDVARSGEHCYLIARRYIEQFLTPVIK